MNGLRVLAVDDQQEILDVVQLALEVTTDWSLTTRRSTASAVAEHDGTSYDVVLLDLNIPGEDAAESVSSLRGHGIAPSIVLLTGSPVSDAERSRVAPDAVLTKPFDPMTLAAQIEAALTA
jgi:DNA-binding response OmpR family regulator